MATLADLLRSGYTPPTASALGDPIKEHFRNLPANLEKNQRAMDKTMSGMYKTDFLGKPNPDYYPEAMSEFTSQYMPNMMGVHLPHTPLKPNATVGTNYITEQLGNLADKAKLKFEDLKGSSALIMPWDSTSRNVAIKSISGEELPNAVVTHGGQDYARDLSHQAEGIVGASNLGIAKRIRDRDAMARIENERMGGTGQVIHMPTTMGMGAENFSVMPTEALLGLVDRRAPSKDFYRQMNEAIRNVSPDGKPASFKPFQNFAGLESEIGRMQLYNGEGIDSTAGELRKALVKTLSKKSQGFNGGNTQQYLNYNHEDLVNALTDPALLGVGKGHVGNTIIGVGQGGMHLKPSSNPTYNTNFTGQYLGTLGENVPVEAVFPKTFRNLEQEFAGKTGSMRNNVLGAMEKRKMGVSEFIDDEAIDNYYRYLQERKRLLEQE